MQNRQRNTCPSFFQHVSCTYTVFAMYPKASPVSTCPDRCMSQERRGGETNLSRATFSHRGPSPDPVHDIVPLFHAAQGFSVRLRCNYLEGNNLSWLFLRHEMWSFCRSPPGRFDEACLAVRLRRNSEVAYLLLVNGQGRLRSTFMA